MTMIMDGGGGCGKTTLSTEVVLPPLETFSTPREFYDALPPTNPLVSSAVAPCILVKG
jgi:hypothetical protein